MAARLRFSSPSAWLPRYALFALLIVYNIFFIAYGLQKHAAFQTAGFDLGIWDQMGWNTVHGRPFWFTQHGNITNGLGNHLELILIMLVLLYGLYKGPQIMIVFQALLVSVGALPIYWLARDRLLSNPDYGLILAQDSLLLFEAGAPSISSFEPGPLCL